MNAPQPQSAASPRPITPLGPPVRRGRSVPLFMALRYLFSRPWFGALYNEANLPLGAFHIGD